MRQPIVRRIIQRVWVVCTLTAIAASCGCRKDPSGGERNSHDTTAWFEEITVAAGLAFVHDNGADGNLFLPEVMGGGVALFDADNDGDLDIYLTNGHSPVDATRTKGPAVNRFYRNDGNGRFTDETDRSGLGDPGYGMGVAVGDIDNDGYLDVYVTNLGPDQLYRNRGDGTFENITELAGVSVDGWSCSATFLDFDRDGYLDIYITRYVEWDATLRCFSLAGQPQYCGPLGYVSQHDILLNNYGDGSYRDVSESTGIAAVTAAGLGAVADDFNDDGWIDLYVANDAYANNLWINKGDGTFEDRAELMGSAYNINGTPEAGMGVVADDLDNDGDIDLFMTHLVNETNTFYRNEGSLIGFLDATGEAGLGWSSVPFTGFGTVAFDAELDGDLDLFLVNGRVNLMDPTPGTLLSAPWDKLAEANLFYSNDGTGRFERVTDSAAALCDPIEITRGAVTGDIDNDGDLDVLITNIQGPARLYRNNATREGGWLRVRAVDPRQKRDAIGARIVVRCGDNRFTRTIRSGYSYLSAGQPEAHFGLGKTDRIDDVVVRWPDGPRERFLNVPMNRAVTLQRGSGEWIIDESTQASQIASTNSSRQ